MRKIAMIIDIMFYPLQTSYSTFVARGRLDLMDEMDGIIGGYIEVINI